MAPPAIVDTNSTGQAGRSRRVRGLRGFFLLLIPLLIATALVFAVLARARDSRIGWEVATITKGDVRKTITATGKTQAVVTVQVGTQVSGRISELLVDYNSRVGKGQVIARIDPALFQAQLDQSKASLANSEAKLRTAEAAVIHAQANVASAEANGERLQIAHADAENAWRRTLEPVETGAVSAREVEALKAAAGQAKAQWRQAVASAEQARAQLLVCRSQVDEAKAAVAQNQAAITLAQTNLDYTVIRAPIDGVVIARNVDTGQTVAANFMAPTLFLIANDLTRMQVLADIDEADVGQLRGKSKVRFTVDAYPSDEFEGTVSLIRLNPQTVQNVVTYTAVIEVDNKAMKLRPGMTATMTAIVAEEKQGLLVPNAALRYRPSATAKASQTPTNPSVVATGDQRGTDIYVVRQGVPRAVRVVVGITDGKHTALRSAELAEGDQVIIAELSGGAPRGKSIVSAATKGGGPR